MNLAIRKAESCDLQQIEELWVQLIDYVQPDVVVVEIVERNLVLPP